MVRKIFFTLGAMSVSICEHTLRKTNMDPEDCTVILYKLVLSRVHVSLQGTRLFTTSLLEMFPQPPQLL